MQDGVGYKTWGPGTKAPFQPALSIPLSGVCDVPLRGQNLKSRRGLRNSHDRSCSLVPSEG